MNLQKLLAENMLRFGSKNLDIKAVRALKRLVEQGATTQPVTIEYKQTYNLPTGQSDPAGYINNMFKGIMDAINANPEAQKMLAAKSIKITSMLFRGGASNSWAGQPTGFDRELNKPVMPIAPTETILYQKNKTLAATRAEACKNALLPLLANQGIKQTANVPTKVEGVVYNTAGVINPEGQIITVRLTVSYLATPDIDDTIVTKFVLNGSYYTKDGKSSTGTQLDTTTYQLSTMKLPANLKTSPNRLAAFEIKWNPNILLNPYKQPWYRWIFIYNAQGKIERIEGRVYDTALNASLQNVFKNNKNISPTDPTLKRMMDIVSPTYYSTFLQPFI